MQTIVTTSFNLEVENLFKEKPETKKYILSHERKNLCIENICKEVRMIELTKAVKLDRERIEYIGKTFAESFCKIVLAHEERKAMTELQIITERKKKEQEEYFQKIIAGEYTEEDRSEEL